MPAVVFDEKADADSRCPGCNAIAVLTHLLAHRDQVTNVAGEPVWHWPTDADPEIVMLVDLAGLSMRLERVTAAISVTSLGTEVYRLTPDGVERHEPGLWSATLAAAADELDVQSGRVRRGCRQHPGRE
jgi:hypothetical protein